MAAHVIKEVVARSRVPPEKIDDVIFGCANQAGEDNRNVARMALLLAGLPVEVPGVTVNRLCGSGMQAVGDAARLIAAGEAEIVVAGGVEQMTRAPLVMDKGGGPFARGNRTAYDSTLGWRFVNPKMDDLYGTLGMGLTAEEVAKDCGVSREAQDEFAVASQRKAGAALASGRFDVEVVPIVTGHARKTKEPVVFEKDEHPREVTVEKLARLRPVFAAAGTVTAGNASGINDGACALVVASEDAVKRFSLKPLARYVSSAACGVEPRTMGLGPIPASKKALTRAGLSAGDIAVSEINEAFAAQAIPCVQQIGVNPDTVNVNGGAIALGHPLGASGARLLLTLMHELTIRQDRYGLASMCIGVGQGIATVIERC